MLCGETVAVYCENCAEHTDTLCGQNTKSCILKHVVYIMTNGFKTVVFLLQNHEEVYLEDKVDKCLFLNFIFILTLNRYYK
jgi:hypothetical protein